MQIILPITKEGGGRWEGGKERYIEERGNGRAVKRNHMLISEPKCAKLIETDILKFIVAALDLSKTKNKKTNIVTHFSS